VFTYLSVKLEFKRNIDCVLFVYWFNKIYLLSCLFANSPTFNGRMIIVKTNWVET